MNERSTCWRPRRQFKMCFKSAQLLSLSLLHSHSLNSSPFWPCPFGGCQAKCSHKYVNVRYVSVPEMPAATANQAKWLHSQSCHRPRPIPIARPLVHMPHLTCHFVQLVCVSINLLSLSHLASEAVKFCINWNHLSYLTPPGNPGNTCNSAKWGCLPVPGKLHQFFHYVVCLRVISGQLGSYWGENVEVGCIHTYTIYL